ncbi:MAG: hypothetical protein WDL87_07855 [Candidatus Omnitrophota bacterium]
MRKYIGFFTISSIVIKILAWIFLCLGILAGVAVFYRPVPGYTWISGAFVLGIYGFIAFLLYLLGLLSGVAAKIIDKIEKSE